MPDRGDRVAPPPRPGDWELRHAGAGDDWEELVANYPSAALACYDALSADPLARSNRQGPLRGELGGRTIGGRAFTRWQYEATGGARVWYCPDGERRIVWITEVHLGAPSRTHRTKGPR